MSGFPSELSARCVDCDDARLGGADVDENVFATDERRASEAEEAFISTKLFAAIDRPVEAASPCVDAFGDAICAECIHVAVVHGGYGARAVVEAELIHISGIGNAFPNHRLLLLSPEILVLEG